MATARVRRNKLRDLPRRALAGARLLPGVSQTRWAGKEIRGLRKTLEATQEEFAQVLDVASSSVHRWEAGRVEPDRRSVEKMSSLDRVLRLLDKHFRAEGRVEFFKTPQVRLDGDRPMDILGLPSAEKRIGILLKAILGGDFS